MIVIIGGDVEMFAEFICHDVLPSEQRRKALHLDKSWLKAILTVHYGEIQRQKMCMFCFIGNVQIRWDRALSKCFEVRAHDKIDNFLTGCDELFFKLPSYKNRCFSYAKCDLMIVNSIQVG